MNICKNGLHELLTPRDIRGIECRRCYESRQHRYDDRRKLALDLLRRMERAGIKESDLRETDGFAIGLAWANAATDRELAEIERQHPAMVAKLRARLEQLEHA